ncbi:MAG: MotA/TolQ/ExbB proton channel family protein [Pirellulales bacterium]|nr:MotA/TolQ/ExbB proton channel family protein [Pirellulales bacterium]
MEIATITSIVGKVIYATLAMMAIWGAFCVIIVWRRVAQTRFRSEEEQDAFLAQVGQSLEGGDFRAAAEICDEDDRAMPQLALLAVENRRLGYSKIRTLVADRFQRDVLSDLEYRLSWVHTVIKSAPMVGLLGTVVGMMGAFAKLSSGDKVDPTQLADDISLALITTACGLAIAIPLVLATASINVRIRKLEDLVSSGITRFLEAFKAALKHADRQEE